MGAVYLAKHLSLDRDVALKVIRPELLTRADVAERFRREAKAAARLNHPNIVAVFDAETAGEHHFLVMEYIAGADLFRTVREGGPLPVGLACDYIRQAAVGLQHAYERGMVHRDITPRNLMLTAAGQIKILDFGLADFVLAATPGQSAPFAACCSAASISWRRSRRPTPIRPTFARMFTVSAARFVFC